MVVDSTSSRTSGTVKVKHEHVGGFVDNFVPAQVFGNRRKVRQAFGVCFVSREGGGRG